jgi:FkbM family methyltransferase
MFFHRIRTSIRWRFLKPKIPQVEQHKFNLKTLGSRYGRKTFCVLPSLNNKILVISAGVGEDISFDIEFLNIFDAQVYLVDPSPISISYFKKVLTRIGLKSDRLYTDQSNQPVESYDLSQVKIENLVFVPFGLWNNDSEIDLFLPNADARDKSGSIVSLHTFYKKNNNHVKINTLTVQSLMKKYNIEKIDILKLDIEGAALEVLHNMFTEKIFPTQILLEIDEMHFPSIRSKFRAEKLIKLLKVNKYQLINQDSCDFLFISECAI